MKMVIMMTLAAALSAGAALAQERPAPGEPRSQKPAAKFRSVELPRRGGRGCWKCAIGARLEQFH